MLAAWSWIQFVTFFLYTTYTAQIAVETSIQELLTAITWMMFGSYTLLCLMAKTGTFKELFNDKTDEQSAV